ncbi:MAG: hypothetical protein QXZ44_02475 [Ferroplasma sp.]
MSKKRNFINMVKNIKLKPGTDRMITGITTDKHRNFNILYTYCKIAIQFFSIKKIGVLF